MDAIEAGGLEAAEADPDRPGTVLDLCGDVAVVVWLLGSAAGTDDAISAIHGPRLERLLEKLVDTPVRGFAYEAVGSVDPSDCWQAAGRSSSGRGRRGGSRSRFSPQRATRPGWAVTSAEKVAGLLTA